ncbi:hypothetical protein [Mobilicoccus massiliensis]|uniref:hypothetical protein n=1 Tax=Mobilicoccus massiliensis TaxID=1522310 RepID=UPI00058C0FF5|nr:hypothetical protein [Mobilicoccus massiliensis]
MFSIGPAHRLVAGIGVVLVLTSSCGAADAGDTPAAAVTQEFAHDGGELTVVKDHANARVHEADVTSVRVERQVTAVGKTPAEPRWSLTDDTLELGQVCDEGYVGLCEVTYDITVPRGTRVHLRD